MTELGSRLKEARQAKGLSLDDLQEMTKIQKRYLKGIEEGNYDMMPGKFYVRAFIKQYAEAVGLETEQVFDEYKNEVPEVYHEELPEQISRVQSRKTVPVSSSKILDIFPKILVAVFIIAAIFLIWFLYTKYSGSNNNEKLGGTKETPIESTEVKQSNKPAEKTNKQNNSKDNNSVEKTQDEKNKTVEEPKQKLKVVNTSGKYSTYQLLNTDKFEVKLSSTGEAWIGVSNDSGHSYFNGILKDGQSQIIDLTKEKQVTFNIGKTPETEIYINGEKFDYPNDNYTQKITIQFEPSKTE
ncbi:helix-turn-helix domain-containing protein [Heyndrickxia sporothermodurans]|uniref:helix-turn-helix domain-containing protein n=1 Tax=Heyndrickxia sporothermodurans TaxID=46224 RepID=UPI002E1BBC12|nr:DUF4115 domain-containing protein [Heyndrickxia sporothermodurans]MED3697829.1 DUF4115 domain-containing protein [Heyndrickxia sporothermodurans]